MQCLVTMEMFAAVEAVEAVERRKEYLIEKGIAPQVIRTTQLVDLEAVEAQEEVLVVLMELLHQQTLVIMVGMVEVVITMILVLVEMVDLVVDLIEF